MQVIEHGEMNIPASAHSGRLDGWTIVRFAHAYESGGGLEQYLADLNLALGKRNRMTIVQMQMTTDRSRLDETVENIGESKLVKIPMLVPVESKHESINARPLSTLEQCKSTIRSRLLFMPVVYRSLTRQLLKDWPVPRRAGEPENAGEKFKELARRFPVKLVAVHSGGGADTTAVLATAGSAGIPSVLVHHFANDRLKSLALGSQIMQARAVGGVCGVDVPAFLRGQFLNLADGIDTEFFSKKRAGVVTCKNPDPILFLPARVTATKGQLDLVRAGGVLLRKGLQFQIVFAGRVDSDEFLAQLKKEIEMAGLTERVTFTGQLDAAGLRNWYAASAVMAFPTHHHEGLPRILLEAQAMELPVVAHNIGGTSEGVINGQTGYLIPTGNQRCLVERLDTLLREPAKRRQFGQAGRRLVEEKFSLQSLAERHETFYLNAVKS